MSTPNGAPRGRARRLLTGLAVLLISSLLGFGALEGLARLLFADLDLAAWTGLKVAKDPRTEWAVVDAYSAYRARAGHYGYRDAKSVNRLGYISTPELVRPKPPGRARLAFFGGSSTAGTGRDLNDDETWPWLTAGHLREQGLDVDFVNAALGGYTTFDSLGRLTARVRFLEPDVAVLYHAWNEMYYFGWDDLHQWRHDDDHGWGFPDKRIQVMEPWAIDPYIGWSSLLTNLRVRLSEPRHGGEAGGRDQPISSTPAQRAQRLEDFRTNLRLFREICAALDIELFVVKQATLIVPDLPGAERARCGYELHGFGHEDHVEAFAAIYRIIDEEIPADRVVDATPLSGKPNLFIDHVHLTVEGTKTLASLVADALRTRSRALAR